MKKITAMVLSVMMVAAFASVTVLYPDQVHADSTVSTLFDGFEKSDGASVSNGGATVTYKGITYNMNGGHAVWDAEDECYYFTHSSNSALCFGWWNTRADDSGADYGEDDVVNIGVKTLYAIWTESEEFDDEAGEDEGENCEEATEEDTDDGGDEEADETIVEDVEPDDGDVPAAPESDSGLLEVLGMSGPIDWDEHSVLPLYNSEAIVFDGILFDPNGGRSEIRNDGYRFYAPANRHDPSGDVSLVCWNTEADQSGTAYFPGDMIDISILMEAETLYAVWSGEETEPEASADDGDADDGNAGSDSAFHPDDGEISAPVEDEAEEPADPPAAGDATADKAEEPAGPPSAGESAADEAEEPADPPTAGESAADVETETPSESKGGRSVTDDDVKAPKRRTDTASEGEWHQTWRAPQTSDSYQSDQPELSEEADDPVTEDRTGNSITGDRTPRRAVIVIFMAIAAVCAVAARMIMHLIRREE